MNSEMLYNFCMILSLHMTESSVPNMTACTAPANASVAEKVALQASVLKLPWQDKTEE